MKRIATFIIFFILLLTNGCTVGAQSQTNVLPITGTWVNLAYKDVRNKYTNPDGFDNTDPEIWAAKVRELKKMGLEYLVLMEVANEGKAYYESSIMPWLFDATKKSPVEAILDEAGMCGLKVFMSTGWAKDQDDNLQDPAIKKRQIEIMEEIAALYKNKKAFYGWYLPVEDCLGPILAAHAVESVNTLVSRARELTPGKKTMISPYGIGAADFDNPEFEKRILALTVDIIAYQDEVGCVRDQFTLPRLKENWKKMRAIHDKTNIEMWANCETFTWEAGTNDRRSALIPASYSRLLAQQVAASEGGVDRIISFMFGGIIEDPSSPYQLGQPIWSNKLCNDYHNWRTGDKYWKYLEASFSNALKNEIPSETKTNEKKLIDSVVAETSGNDDAWVSFETGVHEVILDFNTSTKVKEVFVRMLNYHPDGIEPAQKVYLSFSDDGKHWSLASILNAENFPNNRHDAWIDAVLFDDLKLDARYLKINFNTPSKCYIDEIYINPTY